MNAIFFGFSRANDGAHLDVGHPVDERGDQDDFNARLVHVVNGLELDVEKVPDLAVGVRIVTDAVELKIGVAQAGLERAAREVSALGEFDSVRRRLHAVISDFTGVADRINEVRRHGRLAARELHG